MKINFVGSFSHGYVGEVSDETHLARELEALGHTVQRVPRDIWKAWCEDERDDNWEKHMPIKSDINIFAKWHHFTGKHIRMLKLITGAPVFYWVWDYMRDEEWHMDMVKACDLYISNDVASGRYGGRTNCYYFPFDVADGDIKPQYYDKKKYDVVFFGSCIGQGDRMKWLPQIAKKVDLTIFSWNYKDWQKMGLTANPAVYGEDFAKVVAEGKIFLQFSVNDKCWGYWSNRVGKILTLGGFLLARYAPGMELRIGDGADYFSSPKEAIDKIKYYLIDEDSREAVAKRGRELGRRNFTSKARIKQLCILMERFLG
jgi:hypothetical protein